MALISKTKVNQKEKIKLELSSDVFNQIEAYCAWSQIDDISFFIEEAACYIFSKDKEWKAHQKHAEKSKNPVSEK